MNMHFFNVFIKHRQIGNLIKIELNNNEKINKLKLIYDDILTLCIS